MDLRIHNIRPDGNCFFSSIMYILQESCPFKSISDFRFHTYKYMKQNTIKYKEHTSANYDEAIKKVSYNGIWNAEIFDIIPNVVSDMLKINILIHQGNQKNGIIISIGDEYVQKIHLDYDIDLKHYNALIDSTHFDYDNSEDYNEYNEDNKEKDEKDEKLIEENEYKEDEEEIIEDEELTEEMYEKEYNEYEFYKNLKLF